MQISTPHLGIEPVSFTWTGAADGQTGLTITAGPNDAPYIAPRFEDGSSGTSVPLDSVPSGDEFHGLIQSLEKVEAASDPTFARSIYTVGFGNDASEGATHLYAAHDAPAAALQAAELGQSILQFILRTA